MEDAAKDSDTTVAHNPIDPRNIGLAVMALVILVLGAVAFSTSDDEQPTTFCSGGQRFVQLGDDIEPTGSSCGGIDFTFSPEFAR